MKPERSLCACGCGQPVKGRKNRWATPGCVPRSARAVWAQRSRQAFAYRKRRERFGSIVARLAGRTITREDLFEVLRQVDRRGYNSGYQAGVHRAIPALEESA